MIRAFLAVGVAHALVAHAPLPSASPARGAPAAVQMRTSVIGGNWKMNPTTLGEAKALATEVAASVANAPGESIIFPPYPFLGAVAKIVAGSRLALGAQSIFFEDSGAYTGAVSASMVKSLGVTYVLAGHSERRTLFKDDDAAINTKVKKIIEGGMIPCLCVGETKEEYDAGLCESVCSIQLAKDLAGVGADDVKKMVIAYEPVWAIGTGLVCPSDVAQDVHKFIRGNVADLYDDATADAVRIQYGGSVTPDSVDELMAQPDIDGCLVGGASLVGDKFARILNYEVADAAVPAGGGAKLGF